MEIYRVANCSMMNYGNIQHNCSEINLFKHSRTNSQEYWTNFFLGIEYSKTFNGNKLKNECLSHDNIQ